ncbi:MAG: hypothetical protein QME81_15295 [bacterium]|nr:hypothetical protein [bacterium]
MDAPGALHHVIARGIERREIFRDKSDYHDTGKTILDKWGS